MQLDSEQFFYIVTCSYNLAFQTSFLVRGYNLGIESFGLGLGLEQAILDNKSGYC